MGGRVGQGMATPNLYYSLQWMTCFGANKTMFEAHKTSLGRCTCIQSRGNLSELEGLSLPYLPLLTKGYPQSEPSV